MLLWTRPQNAGSFVASAIACISASSCAGSSATYAGWYFRTISLSSPSVTSIRRPVRSSMYSPSSASIPAFNVPGCSVTPGKGVTSTTSPVIAVPFTSISRGCRLYAGISAASGRSVPLSSRSSTSPVGRMSTFSPVAVCTEIASHSSSLRTTGWNPNLSRSACARSRTKAGIRSRFAFPETVSTSSEGYTAPASPLSHAEIRSKRTASCPST